jgi:myo-inositol-1(or 4)-monophosphatase
MSAAVIKAGKGLLRDFGEVDQLQVSRKGTANFVTATDVRTEKLLQRELSAARPDFGFLLEEGGEVKGKSSEYRWIIDPLDGTSNFIHALPYFCTSVALEKRDANGNSEIVAGVTYDPIHNDLFMAEKGKGALVNNRKLVVSGRATIEDSMLVTGNPHASPKGSAHGFGILQNVAQAGATTRYLGATALDLAYLAAGKIDACWYYTIQPWDIAAGLLLLQEAGGSVTDLEGNAANSYTKMLLATNRQLHPQMLKLLS